MNGLCLIFFFILSSFQLIGQSQVEKLSNKTITGKTDWLLDGSSYKAAVTQRNNSNEIVLDNGLLERRFLLYPNVATISLKNNNNEEFLRAIKPEGQIQINGVNYNIGGLTGQPDNAYIDPLWLSSLKNDPNALQFSSYEIEEPKERFKWKKVRYYNENTDWPPKGVHLKMNYKMPSTNVKALFLKGTQPSNIGRNELIADNLLQASADWEIVKTSSNARSTFENEGKFGEIYTPANTHVYAERDLPKSTKVVEVTIDVGTDESRWWGPGIALVWEDKTVEMHLSPGGDGYNPFLTIAGFDGSKTIRRLGKTGNKLDSSIEWTLRLRIDDNTIYMDAKPQGKDWKIWHTITYNESINDPLKVRIGKMDAKGNAVDNNSDLGNIVRTRLKNFYAYGELNKEELNLLAQKQKELQDLIVTVNYEMYDGIPLYSKWITVENNINKKITINSFTSEILAAVEYTSRVEERGVHYPTPNIHVETDYAFGGFDVPSTNIYSVHWENDPEYTSQVMGLLTTPALLKTKPIMGPEQDVKPNEIFETFRTFILPYDSYERERKSLSLRKMYRTIAPWTTENPLMMHLKKSDWESVKFAIDQCAEVGFEMLILSFGSGFNIEDGSEENIKKMKQYNDYAQSKGIEIGGYSLLSSRNANPKSDNVVSPEGQRPTHGVAPALASPWGQKYFETLRTFFEKTGQSVFEHDGSYPGDIDIMPRPPLQKGKEDSRWVQWRIITDFYKWCRGNGIFLNVPDYYFLTGNNKIGMGYREVNWSLPRKNQVIHTRQNIFDGTWEKSTTMGWMHVPLEMYHGGGAAATIEPLNEHLDHYEMLLMSNLGAGSQAVYRGSRLYDTETTKNMVTKTVDWYKKYRNILDSDFIHIRRADGRDYDAIMHVNPDLPNKGLLMVYNPLETEIKKEINIPIYYTGISEKVLISEKEGLEKEHKINNDNSIDLEIKIPARGYNWYLLK